MGNPVAAWLSSKEGQSWSRQNFSQAGAHAMIELTTDADGGGWVSDDYFFALYRDVKEWESCRWVPDLPPEGGVPVREVGV